MLDFSPPMNTLQKQHYRLSICWYFSWVWERNPTRIWWWSCQTLQAGSHVDLPSPLNLLSSPLPLNSLTWDTFLEHFFVTLLWHFLWHFLWHPSFFLPYSSLSLNSPTWAFRNASSKTSRWREPSICAISWAGTSWFFWENQSRFYIL